VFAIEHVDLRSREVRQAAGMVDVEVGEDDVADVGGIEAKLAHL